MLLKYCITFSVLVTTIHGFWFPEPSSDKCPTFELRCPDCEEGTKCVYPNSGGCSNAGIPTCQALECPNTVCLIQRIPCPKECPYSCIYNGSPCCPFQGKPECAPVCNTFAPCAITPCPESCPNNCYYPNADFCCPKSGTPVCNLARRGLDPINKIQSQKTGGLGYKSGGISDWGFEYSNEAKSWEAVQTPSVEPVGWGYDRNGNYYTCDPNDKNCPFGNSSDRNKKQGYHHNDDKHFHGNDKHFPEDDKHFHGDDDYYEGLFIGGLDPVRDHECSTCTKTITDVDIELKFITTTVISDDIVCPQYIIPCPSECPYDCLYPMDQPCPFTQQPWCPSVFDHGRHKKMYKTLSITLGYEFPHFPTYDPFHSIFTSMLNHSGVTATTSFVPLVPTEIPTTGCPLIFRYCPIECPDSCLRPDVPCPFAAEGYCPGNLPTTTVPVSALITPTAETVVGGELICPLYMLACPMCPKDYTCKRALTGNCPNTNIPYCVSRITETPTSMTESIPSLIYYLPPPAPSHFEGNKKGIYAQSTSSEKDICEIAGLTKVKNKEIFDQLQERHFDCKGCSFLEWDEYCPNMCVFRTEDNCCIQSICLPN